MVRYGNMHLRQSLVINLLLNSSQTQCSRPGAAFGVSKRVKHTAVEATQDVAHQVERAIIHEIGP